MSEQRRNKPLILHPTDFSSSSEKAFTHALSIALAKKSGVSVLHVGGSNDSVHWEHFPGVRDMLISWGMLEANAERKEVYDRLGITVEKVETHTRSVVDGIIKFGQIHKYGTDMLVLATEGRAGLPRWLEPSKAERVAREIKLPTLFVPQNSQMINPSNGNITITDILIPIDHTPDPQFSLFYTVNMLKDMNISGCVLHILYVGDDTAFPNVKLPEANESHCQKISATGDTVSAILTTADKMRSPLIVMATHGHDGFLDVLRGSTTERVMREASCPVLTLPA